MADPDHRGGLKTPSREQSARGESEVIVCLEEEGRVAGPVERPGEGHAGDLTDANGVDWDIINPTSHQILHAEIKVRTGKAH